MTTIEGQISCLQIQMDNIYGQLFVELMLIDKCDPTFGHRRSAFLSFANNVAKLLTILLLDEVLQQIQHKITHANKMQIRYAITNAYLY